MVDNKDQPKGYGVCMQGKDGTKCAMFQTQKEAEDFVAKLRAQQKK